MKGTKVGQGPGMGSVPKGSGAAGRKLDHPSCGNAVGKRLNASHPGNESKTPRESGRKVKSPKPVCYAQGPGNRRVNG